MLVPFFVYVTLVLISTSVSNVYAGEHMHPLSDDFIQHINSQQSLWRAGRNFARDVPMSYILRLMGSLRYNFSNYVPRKTFRRDFKRVPINFDARDRWTYCPTLNDIRDQGSCGSCWAVSAVSAMTDRICIKSKGQRHFYFSAEDVLSCCFNCGPGCNGGELLKAWLYAKRKGVVSGGAFESRQGCLPYEIEPCEHNIPGKRKECGFNQRTPVCKRSCQPAYKLAYKKDKRKFQHVYTFNVTRDIKKEIYLNGPVTASFDVYSDFLNYKEGIYYHVSGDFLGGHSVKILGWGVEKKVKYWLVANTWNTDWGDRGFFKIKLGKNVCGIEEQIVAGV